MDFLNGSRLVQLLHSLLPSVAPKERRLLTFLILMQQLRELMSTIDDLQSGLLDAMPAPEESGEQALFHALESVCTKEEMQSLSQYKQMFQAMQMMQTFQNEDSSGESAHREPSHRAFSSEQEHHQEHEERKSPADLFRSMLSPQQQQMVDAILEQRSEN